MQGVHSAALAAQGQVRANTGTVSVQCLGGYVAGLTPVDGVACKLLLSLFPQHPPFLPIAVSFAVSTALSLCRLA